MYIYVVVYIHTHTHSTYTHMYIYVVVYIHTHTHTQHIYAYKFSVCVCMYRPIRMSIRLYFLLYIDRDFGVTFCGLYSQQITKIVPHIGRVDNCEVRNKRKQSRSKVSMLIHSFK
jgi:hypothetical protein